MSSRKRGKRKPHIIRHRKLRKQRQKPFNIRGTEMVEPQPRVIPLEEADRVDKAHNLICAIYSDSVTKKVEELYNSDISDDMKDEEYAKIAAEAILAGSALSSRLWQVKALPAKRARPVTPIEENETQTI